MITNEDRAILHAVELAAARTEIRRQTEALDQHWTRFIRWKRRSFHHWPQEMLDAYRDFLKAKGG